MAQSKAKSNSVITTRWENDLLHINVLHAGEITFDRTKVNADLCIYAERHGWTQRLCDKAAISAPRRTPGMTDVQWHEVKLAHAQDKLFAVKSAVDYYENGAVAWKMTGLAGEREGGILLESLVQLWTKTPRDKIIDFLKSKDAGYKAGLLISEKVKPFADAIRAERAKSVNTDDALAELEAMEIETGDEEDVDAEIAALMPRA